MNRIKWMYDNGYGDHHKALVRGYVSRKKDYVIKPYVGRFGIGFKVLQPRFNTSRYIDCTYFVQVKFEKCLPISIYEKNNNTICARDMGITGFKDGKTEYHLLDVYGLKLNIDKNRYIIRLEDWDKICD